MTIFSYLFTLHWPPHGGPILEVLLPMAILKASGQVADKG